ncbi:MAG: hypothetical protein VX561_09330 [Pseudomonadota bacterium]|nr:hypothetical protein [Pseudomonadota bacterium]
MVALFKIVDDEAADLVANGSVKLGTAESYADLEDPVRRDALDSKVEYHASFVQTTGMGDAHDAAAKRAGVGVGPGVSASVINCSAVPAVAPRYVYCVTRAYAHQVRPGQVVFEVMDIEGLAKALQSLDDRLGPYRIDWVDYAPRHIDAYDQNARADPFIKQPRFKPECEARITFDAIGNLDAAGFIVGDQQLARFFRRVEAQAHKIG